MNPVMLHVQYLTNEAGERVAVQLPLAEFEALVRDYERQREANCLAAELVESIGEVADMRAGRTPKRPIQDLLNAL